MRSSTAPPEITEDSPVKPAKNKWLSVVVRIGSAILGLIVLGLMLVVLWQEREAILEVLGKANLWWLSLALIATLGTTLLYIAIWHFAARSFGTNKPYFASLIIVSLSTMGRYLPGGVWSLLGLVWQSHRVGMTARTMPILLAVAQGVHLSIAWWVAANGLSFLLGVNEGWRVIVIGILSTSLILGIFLGYRRYIQPLLRRSHLFKHEVNLYSRPIGYTILSSLAVWATGGIKLALIISAFQPSIIFSNLPYMLLYLSWAAALSGIAISIFFFIPLGLGATELSLATLLLIITPDWPLVLAVILLNRVLQVLNDLILSLVALYFFKEKTPRP